MLPFLYFLNFISTNELNAVWHFLDFIISEAEYKLYLIHSHHVCWSKGDRKAIIFVSQMRKHDKLNYISSKY